MSAEEVGAVFSLLDINKHGKLDYAEVSVFTFSIEIMAIACLYGVSGGKIDKNHSFFFFSLVFCWFPKHHRWIHAAPGQRVTFPSGFIKASSSVTLLLSVLQIVCVYGGAVRGGRFGEIAVQRQAEETELWQPVVHPSQELSGGSSSANNSRSFRYSS